MIFPNSNKYAARLFKEWVKHHGIIIALDFDDTISPWGFPMEDLQGTIDTVRRAQVLGAKVIINTACNPERFSEIEAYCKKVDIEITGINQNAVPMQYGNHGKVYANIFLDDRGGLDSALEILESCIKVLNGEPHEA